MIPLSAIDGRLGGGPGIADPIHVRHDYDAGALAYIADACELLKVNDNPVVGNHSEVGKYIGLFWTDHSRKMLPGIMKHLAEASEPIASCPAASFEL